MNCKSNYNKPNPCKRKLNVEYIWTFGILGKYTSRFSNSKRYNTKLEKKLFCYIITQFRISHISLVLDKEKSTLTLYSHICGVGLVHLVYKYYKPNEDEFLLNNKTIPPNGVHDKLNQIIKHIKNGRISSTKLIWSHAHNN